MTLPLFEVTPTAIEQKITERELEKAIVEAAHIFGWRAAHFRGGWSSKGFRTPIAYDGKGFPDLVLVKPGAILFLELKVGKNTLTTEQSDWLEALRAAGVEAHVITEHEWREGYVDALLQRAA